MAIFITKQEGLGWTLVDIALTILAVLLILWIVSLIFPAITKPFSGFFTSNTSTTAPATPIVTGTNGGTNGATAGARL